MIKLSEHHRRNTHLLWDTYPIIAMDTEYDERKIPFLATTTDEQLVCRVYRLDQATDYLRFKNICENPKIVKVWHQCSADMSALKNIGIHLAEPYEDTLVIASLINENFAKVGLKNLAKIFLRENVQTQKTLKTVINALKKQAKKEGRQFSWRDVPPETMIPYAKDDPLYTMKLFYLWKQAIKEYWETYDFEKQLIPVVVDMVQNGFAIDREFVQKQKTLYEQEMSVSWTKMTEILQRETDMIGFLPSSPKQVCEALLALGAPLTKENKRGFSTDASVLQELAFATSVKSGVGDIGRLPVPKRVNEFVKHLLDFRFYDKHHSTYYAPLIDRYTTEDDIIAHFDFYQSGAKTGRFSAELLQTFPRPEESKRSGHRHEVRRCVKVLPGEIIICIDMDQVEMRLFAHYSNSDRLIEAFATGVDPYVMIARDLFGEDLMRDKKSPIYKALRWLGKKIALGLIYGMGVKKMIWTLVYELPSVASQEVIKEIGMTDNRAYEILQDFHKKYPVKDHMHELTRQIYRTGELVLRIDSPKLFIDRAYRVPQELAYKGINVEIQGTAAYALKASMLRCKKLQKTTPYRKSRTRMIGQVHDELIFYSAWDTGVEQRARELIRAIEDRESFKVPLTASAKVSHRSWGEVKEWDGKISFQELLAA